MGEVRAVDVRQWLFEGDRDARVRSGRPLVLRAAGVPSVRAVADLALSDASGPGPALALEGDVLHWTDDPPDAAPPDAGAVVTVRRITQSPDALRHGERVGLHVAGPAHGPCGGRYLVAGAPGRGVALERPDDARPGGCPSGPPPWWAQWEVTGQVPGTGVVPGRPVGLFNVVEGDHVVRAGDGRTGAALRWWAATDPDGALPVPAALRPPDASAGEIEVSGCVVPAGPDAGLLLLDEPVAALLGGHLAARLPDRAAGVASGGVAPSLAVRWPGPLPSGAAPEPGARVWVRGVLAAVPGLALTRVRGAAWPVTAAGDPVLAAPGEPGWPDVVVSWRVVTWGAPVTWALPLPARDGERGSSTTFARLREPVPVVAGPRRPVGGLGAVPPAVARDARSGRRAVRFVGLPGAGPRPSVAGVTARVQLRDRWSR